jgi:hypothetical protein
VYFIVMLFCWCCCRYHLSCFLFLILVMCFNCVVGYFLEGVWVWLLSCLCGLVVNRNIVQKEKIFLGQDMNDF